MALRYQDVYSMALLFAITNLAAILIFLSVVVFAYPVLIIKFLKRWMIYWHGFAVKQLKVDRSFTFEYMEKGDISEPVPSLLLLHGMYGSKDMYCTISKYLPVSRMHIIALDFPGHGNSTRNENEHCSMEAFIHLVEKFVELSGLGKKKFHIGGLSLGGFIAGMYAARNPPHLLSAILMCPAGIDSPEKPRMTRDLGQDGPIIPKTGKEFRQLMSYAFHKERKLNWVILRAVAASFREGESFFRKFLDHVTNEDVRFSLTGKLEAIKVPTLVVWGKEDGMLHVSAVDVCKEKIPHCKTEVLDDCGHAITDEKTKELALLITEFINGVDKKL